MKLLLIGCGNLGRALLKVWQSHQKKIEIIAVQPSLSAQTLFPSVQFVRNVSELPKDFIPEGVILAIKPQQMQEALPSYAKYLKQSLVVSFAAGISLERLETFLLGNKRCLRVMPNVAMKIGRSVNLTYAETSLSLEDRASAEKILGITGSLIWLKEEALIEALTPISASGPAYFFALAEIMTQIAMESGLEESFARTLVQETFIGSALLTAATSDFKEMIASVASKGGVTESALKVLSPGLSDLMHKAYEAALERLKTLGK
ncbi:MAG: hypothetical protein B7Y25_00160 [Alphaproteobacteria bacterium 16-39-46]|nr:MAG: hypothetical protein B7Y25_00160 [Alphaproteobacteria bacterium 16-39-46]OZA44529.1 MAG: hypothetical protein B7X84_00160 [Alphaproteobacteria bacterium 17-39-52]HQS83376.1 pyrroline-5-carboxylate reductase dimerization domain-containing protein [Alphaproteobacteria bacterium]HQS93063.1 pyrroline-5-carboxylate reductase dimerization domain-containing protein [Alphaproteobacteria bacterium]